MFYTVVLTQYTFVHHFADTVHCSADTSDHFANTVHCCADTRHHYVDVAHCYTGTIHHYAETMHCCVSTGTSVLILFIVLLVQSTILLKAP